MALRLGDRFTVIGAVWALSFVGACQPDRDAEETSAGVRTPPRALVDALDRATADRRKARVSNLEYDVFVDVASGADEFTGEVALGFDLADDSSDLSIDFTGGSVASVRVNGDAITVDYNGYFVTVPAAALAAGPTEIRIAYSQPYSREGNGLHRFVDPEDGLAYLYSYLWPYYANRLLPAFDQPNLKAHFTLRVRAPADWTVVSAGPGSGAPAGDGAMLWTFAKTPRIATYMFSLHAGPYRVWQADADGVPLRLLARQSIADFVAVDEWFEITRRGMAFFNRYFDIAYPFAKYDQLIAPEATIGGMENAAAVTFGEQFVQRQFSDRKQREDRADVILHELAHMWFGDFVTHEWWNGMWLNESFAELMATKSLAEVTEFTDGWHGFLINSKKRAYARDSRVTTHPIEMPLDSTAEFHTVWDAITYQKGASVQKQLQHLVGAGNYQQGVVTYLKDNRWGNTTLADFIDHQEESAAIKLDTWTAEWLLQPGFNTLGVELGCSDGTLQSLAITQSAPAAHPTLRSHSIQVALYRSDADGALVVTNILPLKIAGASTAIRVPAGQPCPELVNPNHGDFTYAQIALGDSEVTMLRERLGDIADPMSRSIFLAALYDRALAGTLPLADYVAMALELGEDEQNLRVLEQLTTSIVEFVDLMQRLRPETGPALARLLHDVEKAALQRAHFAEMADAKYLWLNTFLGVASSDAGLGTVRALLAGKAEIAGIDLSPEIRWRLLRILSRHGVADIEALLAAERAGDPSDFGAKQLLAARAAIPSRGVKADWLAELVNPAAVTGLAAQRAVMSGLFPAGQTGLQLAMLEDILATLPELSRERDSYFLSSYAQMLLTPMCKPESAARMQRALDDFGASLDATTLRFLREAQQADSECLLLRSRQQ